jgi:tetratricopeptide (TPR) repeat protein
LEAQEPKTPRLCDKCFSAIAPDADFCPECGAKVDPASASEGSDALINPELARANLLRMRGDYGRAEDVCLAILRQFPNNLTATALLGDVCAESGDLDGAVQWYELALDLEPTSALVEGKLESLRQRNADREAAATAKLLGLPTTKPKGAFVAGALLVFILLIGFSAYTLGRGYVAPRPHLDVEAPVDVPDTASRETSDGAQPTGAEPSGAQQVESKPKDDRDLIDTLARKASDGGKILDAYEDPRSKSLMLTFSLAGNDDERIQTARWAVAALDAVPAAASVTVRAVREDRVVMVADTARGDLARVRSEDWEQAHQDDPDAWIDEVLTNVWPQKQAAPPSQ